MQGEIIYEYGKNPVNYGKIEDPSYMYIEKNHSCGEFMIVYIVLEKESIAQISFEGDGRMVGIAAMSLLTEYMEDKPFAEVENIDQAQVLDLLEIEALSQKRLTSALLGLLTLKNAYRTFYKKPKLDFHDILKDA